MKSKLMSELTDGTDEDRKPVDVWLATRAGRRWAKRNTRRGVATIAKRVGRNHTAGRGLSAREWFQILRPAVLAARPVLGETRTGQPIYGRSTFRNVRGGDPE